jgi:hypothetical protein
MAPSKLKALLDSTVAHFTELKNDDSLTLGEVLKVATGLLKEIYTFKDLSTDEKKGLVFLALRRGLDAVGHLKGLSHVDPGILAEVEKQSLHMAVTAVFGLGEAFPQAFAEVQGFLSYVRRFLSKYLPACSEAAAVASVLDPADGELIAEAVKALKAVTAPPAASDPAALEVRTLETIQESQVLVVHDEDHK